MVLSAIRSIVFLNCCYSCFACDFLFLNNKFCSFLLFVSCTFMFSSPFYFFSLQFKFRLTNVILMIRFYTYQNLMIVKKRIGDSFFASIFLMDNFSSFLFGLSSRQLFRPNFSSCLNIFAC